MRNKIFHSSCAYGLVFPREENKHSQGEVKACGTQQLPSNPLLERSRATPRFQRVVTSRILDVAYGVEGLLSSTSSRLNLVSISSHRKQRKGPRGSRRNRLRGRAARSPSRSRFGRTSTHFRTGVWC